MKNLEELRTVAVYSILALTLLAAVAVMTDAFAADSAAHSSERADLRP